MLGIRREREDVRAVLVLLSSEMHPWGLSAFLTPKESSGSTLTLSPPGWSRTWGAGSDKPRTRSTRSQIGVNPDPLLDFSSSLRLTSLHRRKHLSLCLLLAL